MLRFPRSIRRFLRREFGIIGIEGILAVFGTETVKIVDEFRSAQSAMEQRQTRMDAALERLSGLEAKIAELADALTGLQATQRVAHGELLGALSAISAARNASDAGLQVRLGEVITTLRTWRAEREAIDEAQLQALHDSLATEVGRMNDSNAALEAHQFAAFALLLNSQHKLDDNLTEIKNLTEASLIRQDV